MGQGDSKKGVFGGDKVELLIQDLLISFDQEGGHEGTVVPSGRW